MRASWLLLVAATALSSACYDNPTAEYAQRIVGSWRMAGSVAGKPAQGMLHIMPEGDYILDNGASARVAKIAAPDEGRWSLLHDELRLLALQASPISGIGLEQVPPRLHIVALDQQRLVTTDPDHGVRIEWVRVNPLN
ncbi:MAG TPA: hypothetical protein VNZ68_05190 [Rhodocyclaceae bacterium]|nr:hypothetical protein [Rhodocyclaceae bacterium]